MKGFIELSGINVQEMDSLVLLNSICANYDLEFKNIMEQCMFLDRFTVEVCCPNSIDIGKEEVVEAIHNAELIFSFF